MYSSFLDLLSDKWNLPWLREASGAHQDSGLVTLKLKTTVDDLRPFSANPRATKWASSKGRLWIQTERLDIQWALFVRARLPSASLRSNSNIAVQFCAYRSRDKIEHFSAGGMGSAGVQLFGGSCGQRRPQHQGKSVPRRLGKDAFREA